MYKFHWYKYHHYLYQTINFPCIQALLIPEISILLYNTEGTYFKWNQLHLLSNLDHIVRIICLFIISHTQYSINFQRAKIFLKPPFHFGVLSKVLSSRWVFNTYWMTEWVLFKCSASCEIFLSCVFDFFHPVIISITIILIQLNRTTLWATKVLSLSLKVSKSNFLENSFNRMCLMIFLSTSES